MTKVPGTSIALLTHTRVMGCWSWSLPAGPTVCAGFTLKPGSICASCYAAQGAYRYPNVARAQNARLDWWQSAPDRVAILTTAIAKAASNGYFRVFDSGDFTIPPDVLDWWAICKGNPKVQFWFPTRVWHKTQFLPYLQELASLPNVAVRASGLTIDGPVPPILPLTSLVASSGPGCPKQTLGTCEAAGCRACWSRSVPTVTYRAHGHLVSVDQWRKR